MREKFLTSLLVTPLLLVGLGLTIRHPSVIRTYETRTAPLGGRVHHFIVMEYVEGQTARELLTELGHVPEELCRHIGVEIAAGLAAIHTAGAVHRDLKLDNVLITPDHQVKIMDLGVARLAVEAIRLEAACRLLETTDQPV